MRALLLTTLAAAGIAFALPAAAQDFYVGTPGVGVEIGPNHYSRDRDRYRYDEYDRTQGYSGYGGTERCRTTVIRRSDGSVRRIRRCQEY